MENEKSEHVIRSAVAGATRMPSDATDDDEVRERGVVPSKRFHCGRPNPVQGRPACGMVHAPGYTTSRLLIRVGL